MKLKSSIVALICGSLVYCKPIQQPESVIKADGADGGQNCRNLLTEPEEIRILEFASELASETLSGKISASSRDKQLDQRINGTPKGMKRNAVRFAIAKAMELSASAWVLPRAISYLSDKSLSAADLKALESMGVDRDYADAYMADVGNYFAKPYKTMQGRGFKLSKDKGWSISEASDVALSELKKDSKFTSAFILFFGVELAGQVLSEDRGEVVFADNVAITPPESGKISFYEKSDWDRRVRDRLQSIERDAESFMRSSKEASSYSNQMKGRILEWFGGERGYKGKTAPEIDMESSYKGLLANIKSLREHYGVRKDMRDKLFTLMNTLNDIDLQNINDGMQKLNTAMVAAIAAPFVPVVIWAAPYAGAFALGEAWGPMIAASSAHMALLPMAFAAGTSAIAAGIRTSSLGGGFLCNFYEQFTDRSANALISAPFMAAVPVVLSSAAGAASLASGSICAQTAYGVLNLGMSVGAIGMMTKSGIKGLESCYDQVQRAHKAGEDGSMRLVDSYAEKAYQTCTQAGMDLGFAVASAGKLSKQAYEAIRSKSWQPLIGDGCGPSLGLLDGGCGGSPRDDEKVATLDELKPLTPESGRLHTNINNQERWEVIRQVPLDKTTSAPGHDYLRRPESVVSMGEQIAGSNDKGFQLFKNADRIVLNVYTDGNANVTAIEVLDGNHRFAAGLYAEKISPGKGWATIGDIPTEFVEVRVNGFNTTGNKQPRWIPLHIAEESSIPRDQWRFIPPEWGAKGPTAEIAGDIASTSSQFKAEHRGVSLLQVLRTSLERINVKW